MRSLLKSSERLDFVFSVRTLGRGNLWGYRLDNKKYCALRYALIQKTEKGIAQNNTTKISPISTNKIKEKGIKRGSVALNAFFLIIRMIRGSTFGAFCVLMVFVPKGLAYLSLSIRKLASFIQENAQKKLKRNCYV
jgi:hypothetical protein